MIVLDAAALIALLNARDPHAVAATELLEQHPAEPLAMSTINKAEALVGPAKHGLLEVAVRALADAGIRELAMPPDAAERLASLRATTRCKLPDCCALLAAQQTGATLATFDADLAAAAEKLGLQVLTTRK